MKAQQFLDAMMSTANAFDLETQMNLISKEVGVFGIPDFEAMGYQDWCNLCEPEFSSKRLKRVSYQGMNIISETPDKIMFKPIETVAGTDGTTNTSGVEFIVQQEDDGQWRVSQERLLPENELENDKRCGAL